MKKHIIFLGAFALSSLAYSQVRIVNSSQNQTAANSSAFIDASSNSTTNNTSNIGKGLLFPRTDLSTFTAFGGSPVGIGTSYPTRYDGFVVYNTRSGGTAGIGATEGTLTEGFWYYENKSTTLNGGTWRPVKSNNTTGENIYTVDGTLAATRTVNTNGNNLSFTGTGNVGIGTTANGQDKLQISGDTWTSGKVTIGGGTKNAALGVSNVDAAEPILRLTSADNNRRVTVLDAGNVGIGTQTIQSSVLLDVAGSVRGGSANRTAIVGDNSFAMGSNTIASGNNAMALGNETRATGSNSVSIGYNLTSSGSRSFAAGSGNKAIGEDAFAMGTSSEARGDRSMAFGYGAIAIGANSTSLGWESRATGDRSFATGYQTEARGTNSIAFGWGTLASGDRSFAMGLNSIASQEYAIATGNTTRASGKNSATFGANTVASGAMSFSMGNSSVASGDQSFASGNSTALGVNSASFGSNTTASGDSSAAFGLDSRAIGDRSVAMGRGTLAYNNNELSIGQWSQGVSNGGDPAASTSTIFQIGNGTSADNRSNAMTVRRTGWVGIGYFQAYSNELLRVNGDTRITGDLYVGGTKVTVPDYVFEKHFDGISPLKPDYQMMSLEDVEEFTRIHKHLPGVLSAKEIAEQNGGYSITEATRTNLEKIEELYLYIIELNKEVKALKEELNKKP